MCIRQIVLSIQLKEKYGDNTMQSNFIALTQFSKVPFIW